MVFFSTGENPNLPPMMKILSSMTAAGAQTFFTVLVSNLDHKLRAI